MKFLVFPGLSQASARLQHLDLGDIVICGTVEAYSCKKSQEDKKLQQNILHQMNVEIKEREHLQLSLDSPLGLIGSGSMKKLLISLITTMNASFPDYDFSNLDAFCFEKAAHVNAAVNLINVTVINHADSVAPSLRTELWTAINEAIDLAKTDVYTFASDSDSPFSQGMLWSFCHFFYNAELRRVILFTCSAKSKLTSPALGPMRPAAKSAGGGVDDDYEDLDAMGADVGEFLEDWSASDADSESGAAATGVVDLSALDWDELGDREVFLPDCPWIAPGYSGPQPAASGDSSGLISINAEEVKSPNSFAAVSNDSAITPIALSDPSMSANSGQPSVLAGVPVHRTFGSGAQARQKH